MVWKLLIWKPYKQTASLISWNMSQYSGLPLQHLLVVITVDPLVYENNSLGQLFLQFGNLILCTDTQYWGIAVYEST